MWLSPFLSCDTCCFSGFGPLCNLEKFTFSWLPLNSFTSYPTLSFSPAGYVGSFMSESSSCPVSDYIMPLWEPFNWAWQSPSLFSYAWPEKPFPSDAGAPISSLAGAIIFLPFSWFLYCPFWASLFFLPLPEILCHFPCKLFCTSCSVNYNHRQLSWVLFSFILGPWSRHSLFLLRNALWQSAWNGLFCCWKNTLIFSLLWHPSSPFTLHWFPEPHANHVFGVLLYFQVLNIFYLEGNSVQ